eukprot:TRINITY_DN96585_c0_g1_i1.p1 TRINITY_DN96585_c0_g1~~TRINITY_DN96585_c0_g1_i1.p1  ORF type:complete len:304 (+),score=50.72 TRINITY_DN96585_c0_g1_i1:108-914(+)
MTAKWTGDLFNEGLYDIHIHLKHVPLLEAFPEKDMITMRASDVMNDDVLAVCRVETIGELVQILGSCSHHAFPVIHHESKHFVGMIKRSHIHQILFRGKAAGLFQAADGNVQRQAPTLKHEEFMKDFPKYPSLEDIKDRLEEEDMAKRVDFKPFMNRGGYTVPEHAALTRVYQFFRAMGLRHLPVVSHEGDVCGIITRKDLILAHGEVLDDSAMDNPRTQRRRMSFRRNSIVLPPGGLFGNGHDLAEPMRLTIQDGNGNLHNQSVVSG